MTDNELEQKLSKWELDIPDDRGFQSAVWREIAMRESNAPPNRFREAFERGFAPRYAIPTGVAAMLATVALATFHGMESRQRTWNSLAAAYSQVIDPISHSEQMRLEP